MSEQGRKQLQSSSLWVQPVPHGHTTQGGEVEGKLSSAAGKKRVQVCRGVTKDDEFEPAASSAVLRDCALIFTDQDFFPLTVTECFANQYCPCFPLRGLTCRCCSAAFSELITTSNGSFRRCKGQHCIFTASLIIWRCRHMKHTTR